MAATTRRIRVVIADDRARPRRALCAFLGIQRGVAVVGEASSGAEAVELAGRLRPDVVVMDVEMPGMDGVAATRAIMAGSKQTAVIGVSMYAERRDQMLAAGACAFVAKAELPEQLVAAIYAAVNRT